MSVRRNEDLIALIQDLESRVSKLEQGVAISRITVNELTLFDPRSGQKITITVGRDLYTTPGGKVYPIVGGANSLVIYNLFTGTSPTVVPVP